MRFSRLSLVIFLVFSLALFLGCNAFESLDRSVDSRGGDTLLEHGNYKLASASYADALDLFKRAGEKGGNPDEVCRGLGASYAGLAGFNMFSLLNALQNEVADSNSAAVIFFASAQIDDYDLLLLGLEQLNAISTPGNQDYLLRSLMAICGAAHSFYEKFDTYTNNKLDTSDQITFAINDATAGTWARLYTQLSSDTGNYSLEKAYRELTLALEGRGVSKTTMTPFQNNINNGLYTDANFKTIAAVEKFASIVELANIAYLSGNEALFKQHIMSLDDGAGQ